jgi:hypothetical protein
MKTVQHKRGTAAIMTANNPVLGAGEIGIETDTNQFKIGDGSTVWASLPYAVITALNKFLNFPTAGIDIYPRGELTNAVTAQTAGQPFYAFFTPSTTVTVSAITMGTTATAGSGLTLARMGLYTFDETTATLVARTASDTTLFTAAATTYTRSFDTTGGYPANYTLTAGTRYGVGVFSAGTTLPAYVMKTINNGVGNLTPRMAAVSTSASDLPTSITMGNSNTMVFARLT